MFISPHLVIVIYLARTVTIFARDGFGINISIGVSGGLANRNVYFLFASGVAFVAINHNGPRPTLGLLRGLSLRRTQISLVAVVQSNSLAALVLASD